ncbi:hypothetical protein TNCV_111041 [Trichonephila clavipes]|nr:hypothetical protein TNCV_111041 [Trichonephila clavipes]
MIWIHLEPRENNTLKRKQNSSLWINLPGPGFEPETEEVQSNALPTRLSGLVANYACGIAPFERRQRPAVILFKGLYSERVMGPFV